MVLRQVLERAVEMRDKRERQFLDTLQIIVQNGVSKAFGGGG